MPTRALLLILAILFAATARAQPLLGPAAGSIPRQSDVRAHSGHGWAIVPEPRGGGWLLVHLPPRARATATGSLVGVQPGTARIALRLSEAPEAMAAVGDDVYLVFRSTRTPRGPSRQVYSLSAVAALGDLWAYAPSNRLSPQPPLPGDGVLVGFAATPVGPAALIDRGPREGASGVESSEVLPEGARTVPRPPPQLTLQVLWGGEWRPVALPELPAPETAPQPDRILRRFMLASDPRGLTLLATRPARHATIWRAPLTIDHLREPERIRRNTLRDREDSRAAARRAAREAARQASPDAQPPAAADDPEDEQVPLLPASVNWQAASVQLPGAEDRTATLPTGPLSVIGPRILFAHIDSPTSIGIYSIGPGPPERLTTLGTAVEPPPPASTTTQPVPREASVLGVVGLAEPHRLALILAPPGEQGERGLSVMDAALKLRLVELSSDTGAIVFDGPSRTGSPIDKDEFQAVLLVILGVTALLLVWTVRGGMRREAITLPPGSALAEPGKRLLGGAIDFLIAGVLTGWIMEVPLLDVLSLRIIVGPGADLQGIGILLGVGIGMSTLMEGILGLSPGKLAMGIRVVASTGPRSGTWRSPGIARALVRNTFRWLAAPIAILGLGRPDGRHAGDTLTGVAVVVRVMSDEDQDSPPEAD